ncbi:TAXI family TRAP transporter solute-binding subunit [Sulfitobacter pseudonitzschiae]|uniref:TAXI family TRAP transporter solute-binding subunit n=1 Tax=Roseobacteraceae TaxID=2854170 RepID=UPI001AF3ADB0|nr:TAXI family TRAP transporter solute-binding subunit [Pseudosulfitobacter pseudonitzschiae]MBM1817003.1 TAXI family TRAP transporter solute-binding subunit [Pseudosulfitobacter pseudonitzschiae]MBM1834016.1 TAXI family TRAP transporter solute-binding subunit [Pseudosulfitobacter pseudonitzschiae]MBM1838882.1 TAXI family TRAP transporter solute-binding subunit [Pseudosulfitobacter pseudonitzschiae]MBM1843731.1 TAXI family TRAP transporter solute-binding subunit [Pseudosulfitobacter pseudonitzs
MTLLKTLAAAALLATGLAPAVQAQVQSFSTPPQGSVWNTMASVISGEARKSAGMRLVVQPYGGNAQMMQAVNEALAEFSLNDVNDVITAVQGSGDYTAAMPNLRIVARINPFPVGLYVKESSGLTSVADLEGRSVPSGWDAFPIARSHISAILAAGGIGWEDVDQVPVPELIRGSDDMASGRVDSAFFAVGGPKVAEVDASVGGVRFLGITANDETLAKIRKVRPAFYFSEVTPAPVRVGVAEPMMFVTWDNVLVAGAHVSDEQVQSLLAVLFDEREAIGAAYPPLNALNLETAFKEFPGVDYHPGAVAFFEDRGVEMTSDQ